MGGKMVFFSLAMFIPILIIAIGLIESPAPLILPATLFVTGIFWMLYYRLFGDEYSQGVRQPQAMHPPTRPNAYLPPSPPSPAYRQPVETPQHQSVVEKTTRSLGQQ
jgi:hypothetical protein